VTEPAEVGVAGVETLGAYALVRLADEIAIGPPGTFAMVRDPAGAAFLPRPVGLFRLDDGAPAFLVDPSFAVGALARAARLTVLAPLGHGFDLDGADPAGTLLVAGGIGITVFAGVRAGRLVAGFRTAEQAAAAALVDAPATIRLTPALVTDDLDLGGVSLVLASGPQGMVRAVAAVAAGAGVPCQVALEAPMACGFGACHGCAVRLDGTWKRLCIEGPVVAAERLR
jgi:dihydroorotate dehydrogenase electron transfer subunit